MARSAEERRLTAQIAPHARGRTHAAHLRGIAHRGERPAKAIQAHLGHSSFKITMDASAPVRGRQ